MIAGQLVLETVDGRQRHLRAVNLGHRDGPVEGDDRRGVDADELVVEGDDLRPVGVVLEDRQASPHMYVPIADGMGRILNHNRSWEGACWTLI